MGICLRTSCTQKCSDAQASNIKCCVTCMHPGWGWGSGAERFLSRCQAPDWIPHTAEKRKTWTHSSGYLNISRLLTMPDAVQTVQIMKRKKAYVFNTYRFLWLFLVQVGWIHQYGTMNTREQMYISCVWFLLVNMFIRQNICCPSSPFSLPCSIPLQKYTIFNPFYSCWILGTLIL
jgi:hypothetical protein